ncbi:MAG: right-handed parallel beta-helix repeat-containing protein [Candidatus Methylacidiphilales bacterium]|nr:right-handed parallel beta-helix repeat-containing protein [Candidatus Methylacidiphilales bacterium]
MKPTPILGCLLFAGIILAGLSPAPAAEYWVATTGNDTASGSKAEPWRTIQRAVNSALAGDTISLRGGTYAEFVTFDFRSGSEGQPITLKPESGESVLLDGSTLTVPANTGRALVYIYNSSYIRIEGLEIANLSSAAPGAVPVGILVEGSGKGITLRDNFIHHIRQTRNALSGVDAHAIAFYGNAKAIPLSDITIAGNEIADCLLGSSEALVLNGNVENFTIENNTIHDCNNIGIDLIGYEKTSKSKTLDRARKGVVRENTVYNIDTDKNPAYGGHPDTGGGDRSAAGIYVDGGTNIIIERNHVFHCNFGIELASEAAKGSTDQITMRDNLIHHNMSAGLAIGGYDSKRGSTRNCTITHNTFYRNDTLQTGTGQISLQWYVSNCSFTHNILWADPTLKQMIVHDPYLPRPNYKKMNLGAGVAFNYNRYYHDGGDSSAVFTLVTRNLRRNYTTLAAWQADATGLLADANSTFGDPGFATPVPVDAPADPSASDIENDADQYKLGSASAVRDLGQPGFIIGSGEEDFFGDARIQGGAVGIGADER